MQALHRALAFLGLALLTALLVGLLRTRKAKESLAFSTYVAAVVVFGVLILSYPAAYSPEVFLVKQGIYDALLFGIALELSFKVFGTFTGVAFRVRTFLAVAVTLSTTTVLLLTPPNLRYADLARYQPGVTTAAIWCLSFVGLLIVWYQIPVRPFSRSIILGFVPYLVVFVICTDLIGRWGWGAIPQLNVANALAYDALAAYWVYSAWRKD